MDIRVLGVTEVEGALDLSRLGGAQQQAVLGLLVCRLGDPITIEWIQTQLWPDGPATRASTVSGYLSDLRGLVGRDLLPPRAIQLRIDPARIDLFRFEQFIDEGMARRAEDPVGAVTSLRAALGEWRSEPFATMSPDVETLEATRHHLERRQRLALETLFAIELDRQNHAEIVEEVVAATAAHSDHPTFWIQRLLVHHWLRDSGQVERTIADAERAFDTHNLDVPADLADVIGAIVRGEAPQGHESPWIRPSVPADTVCPYKGLAAFQPEDAAWFHGREALVARLTNRVVDDGFVAVVGPSGSGKSSTVRAGVHVELARRYDARPVLFTPGETPLANLQEALAAAGGCSGQSDTVPISELVDAVRVESGNSKVAVIIDQFEELYTLGEDPVAVEAFCDVLADLHGRDDVLVVVAMRADFAGHVAGHHRLARIMSRGWNLVGPMTQAELHRAIVEPASQAGLRLEEGLAERIIDDVGSEPGSLPLLSHALFETWVRRNGIRLTHVGYNDAGGVHGAMAQSADALFDVELDDDEQTMAKRILLRLVDVSGDGLETRRPLPLQDLSGLGADAERVATRLADARLVTAEDDRIELAHEALLYRWPRLVGWIRAAAADLQRERQVTVDATQWENSGRSDEFLYGGARLAESLDVLDAETLAPSDAVVRFLDASRTHDTRQVRDSRLLRLAGLGMALLVAVAIGGTGVRVWAWNNDRLAKNDARAPFVEIPATDTESAFWLHQHEVTFGQYRTCVNRGPCDRPSEATEETPDELRATLGDAWIPYRQADSDWPVRGVNAVGATTFCEWLDHELPARKDYERAIARGVKPTPPDSGLRSNVSATDDESPSVDGVFHLLTGVTEWTRTVSHVDESTGVVHYEVLSDQEAEVPDETGGDQALPAWLPEPDFNESINGGFRCSS